MTWFGLVCGAIAIGGGGLCCAAETTGPTELAAPAGDANNSFPYAVIVTRNAFGLNPAPPPPAPPAALADLPEVFFSGTVGHQSKMKAMFALKTKDAKKQETTSYLSLAEGEKSGQVEVVRIAPSGDEVEIINSGTRVVMNMKDNGFEKKSPAAPAATPLPGVRQLPGSSGAQLPGGPAQAAAAATPYDGVINVGRRAGSPPSGSSINVQGPGSSTGGGAINPVTESSQLTTRQWPITTAQWPPLARTPGGAGSRLREALCRPALLSPLLSVMFRREPCR